MDRTSPRTPFSTPLSGSARQAEARIRNLFHGLISFRYAEGAQSSRVKTMRLTCSPSKKNRRASP